MTVTVTMTDSRMGEDGTLWAAGTEHEASETFAKGLVQFGWATAAFPDVTAATTARGRVTAAGEFTFLDHTGAVIGKAESLAAIITEYEAGTLGTNHSRAIRGIAPMRSATLGTTTATHGHRFMVRAPFRRVRFHVLNADTAAVSGTYTMVAGVTELSAATSDAISHPTVGGVQTKALRADAGSPGWAAVTWDGGDATKAVAQATSARRPGIATSDWLTMRSVPCTDGPGYLLLLRYDVDTGNRTTSSGLTNATLPRLFWNNATTMEMPWWFPMDARSVTAGGGIADLTKTLVTASNPFLLVYPEFEFDVPAVNIYAHGDSLTDNQGTDVSGFSLANWVLRAAELATISAGGARVYMSTSSANGGDTFAQYSEAQTENAAMHPPGLFLHPVWSPNDGAPSATTEGVMLANLDAARGAAAAAGHRLVTWAQLPNSGYDTEDDAFRLAQNATVRAIAAATKQFDFYDPNEVLSDMATPARFITTLESSAGNHPNEAGVEALGAHFAAWLTARY